MAAPNLTFTVSAYKISANEGHNVVSVSFQSDIAYTAFECRATEAKQGYGKGIGTLIAAFSTTPASVSRTFEIYDEYLTAGDGEYRISLYAQGEDGSWNDNHAFIPSGSKGLITSDGKSFLCMR